MIILMFKPEFGGTVKGEDFKQFMKNAAEEGKIFNMMCRISMKLLALFLKAEWEKSIKK